MYRFIPLKISYHQMVINYFIQFLDYMDLFNQLIMMCSGDILQ